MTKTTKRALTGALTLAVMAVATGETAAQSVATRTPNLIGGWTAPRGVIQLNFLHRFNLSDAPLRKVSNTPTFNVGTGLSDDLMVGFVYGSNSDLVPAYPNEWEFYARALPLRESDGAPLDVSLQAGYNVASESVDGEVILARTLGPVRLLAAGRAFTKAYDDTDTRYAVAGGAALRLTERISLAGDYGVLLDRSDNESATWGAGVQVGIPFTPHSFSIHASNVGTASLEGASRGNRTRWGFEYTVPITLRRYAPRRSSPSAMEASEMAPGETMMAAEEAAMEEPRDAMIPMMMADTVVVEIENLQFSVPALEVEEGTTVVWRNGDPLQHSVTSDDEAFDSGLIDPGNRFTMTFSAAGTYAYHCTPHPFMQGRVVVREAMEDLR